MSLKIVKAVVEIILNYKTEIMQPLQIMLCLGVYLLFTLFEKKCFKSGRPHCLKHFFLNNGVFHFFKVTLKFE